MSGLDCRSAVSFLSALNMSWPNYMILKTFSVDGEGVLVHLANLEYLFRTHTKQ